MGVYNESIVVKMEFEVTMAGFPKAISTCVSLIRRSYALVSTCQSRAIKDTQAAGNW